MRKQDPEAYRGFRTAGIRLREELTDNLAPHRTEGVSATLYAVHRFDKAHLVMLTEEGLVPREDGVALLSALRDMEDAGVAESRMQAQGGMHSGEQFLIRRLGEDVGGRIHLGRSSGDLSHVSNNIYLRDQLLALVEAINRYRRALVELAERHVDTVMPGYTQAQSAQPTTFAHQLLGWEVALARDVDRARAAYEHVNVSPAGGAVFTGSSFALDRHRTCELLGFDVASLNTFDALMHHDKEIEVASTLAVHAHTMARSADDLMLYASGEFGMIEVPDRFCGTSSIMMQKKNPYATQHVKGTFGDAVGGLMTMLTVESGPTGMPILDRRYGQAAIRRQFDNLRRNLDWMTEMVPELVVNTEVMRERAGAFWGQATDVAASLVSELGMNWRSAHQIVGIVVRFGHERGLAPHEVTTELIDEAAVEYMGRPVGLDADVLAAALDPVNFVRGRDLYGGPAPDAVLRELPTYVAGIERDEAWLSRRHEQQRDAEAKLETAIDALLSGPA